MKNYVKKGSKIYIEGQLSTRKWTDKEGNDQYTTEVVLKGYNGVLILLGSNSNQSVEQGLNSPAQGNKPAFDNAMLDDEIPF
jgi:single-strand DNA-binding protein